VVCHYDAAIFVYALLNTLHDSSNIKISKYTCYCGFVIRRNKNVIPCHDWNCFPSLPNVLEWYAL